MSSTPVHAGLSPGHSGQKFTIQPAFKDPISNITSKPLPPSEEHNHRRTKPVADDMTTARYVSLAACRDLQSLRMQRATSVSR